MNGLKRVTKGRCSALRTRLAAAAALALPLLLTQPARAQVAQPTLDKIRAANMIAIGYRETSVPFSYMDANGNVIGFSQDICNRAPRKTSTFDKIMTS